MSHPLDARQTKPIADTASLLKNSETAQIAKPEKTDFEQNLL